MQSTQVTVARMCAPHNPLEKTVLQNSVSPWKCWMQVGTLDKKVWWNSLNWVKPREIIKRELAAVLQLPACWLVSVSAPHPSQSTPLWPGVAQGPSDPWSMLRCCQGTKPLAASWSFQKIFSFYQMSLENHQKPQKTNSTKTLFLLLLLWVVRVVLQNFRFL